MYKKLFVILNLACPGFIVGMQLQLLAKNVVQRSACSFSPSIGIYNNTLCAMRWISSSQLKKAIARQDKAIAQQRDAIQDNLKKLGDEIKSTLSKDLSTNSTDIRLLLLKQQLFNVKITEYRLRINHSTPMHIRNLLDHEKQDLEEQIKEITIKKALKNS